MKHSSAANAEHDRAIGEWLRKDHRVTDPLDYHVAGPGKDASPMSTRLSNETKYLLNELVASRRTPFRTTGEVLRTAVVWFLNEIMPRFQGDRLDDAWKHFMDYVDGSENDALLLNVGRLQAVAKDKIGKLMAIKATHAAAREYLLMLRVAEHVRPEYGKVVRAWAEAEAAFAAVRPVAERMEAAEKETPASLCECTHRKDKHAFARDKDGEEISQCKVRGCTCHEWRFVVPEE